MTVTLDDSALLRLMGIVLLTNISSLSAITLLHGNDITIYPANALT